MYLFPCDLCKIYHMQKILQIRSLKKYGTWYVFAYNRRNLILFITE